MNGGKITIADLRTVPQFAADVADRVWRAWWKPKGVPLEHIADLVGESLGGGLMPAAFVAYRGPTFMGTASLIACDMEERPHLTPWVAAVWVDPPFRQQGIGGTIVGHAARAAFAAGADTVYLCAVPARRHFYQRLGWSLHEQDVGGHGLDLFTRKAI